MFVKISRFINKGFKLVLKNFFKKMSYASQIALNTDHSIKNNIECIILAEFDITEGSRIKYQYPKSTGIEKQYLRLFFK